MESGVPEVSVCIPVYNGEQWIENAVRSALSQTHADLELVVVDNASTDGTRQRICAVDDPRIRLYRNSRNLGVCRNWNRAMAMSRGRYVKPLAADDVLHETCVAEMLTVFRSDPGVGLVFSPREVELEDPDDPAARSWKSRHEATPARFGEIQTVNSGDALLRPWLRDRFASNWVGEPSNVMVSRECLRRVGTFNVRMHERLDQDLWARAMVFFRVGYVDRPLARFLVRSSSETGVNRATGRAWLDRLWFLEGLLTFDEVRERYPEIARLRTRAIADALRNVALRRRAPREGALRDLWSYAGFRARGRGERSRIYPSVDYTGPPGETLPVESGLLSRRDVV